MLYPFSKLHNLSFSTFCSGYFYLKNYKSGHLLKTEYFYTVALLVLRLPPLAGIQQKSQLPQWLQLDPLSGIIFSPSRLQESLLCASHKGHLCYKTLHGSVLSYGKLSKLPVSPYYPDRRQKVLADVFSVH